MQNWSSCLNDANMFWVMKYGTKKQLPHHINSILVEYYYDFKLFYGKIIRGIFLKTPLLLSHPNLYTNTQYKEGKVVNLEKKQTIIVDYKEDVTTINKPTLYSVIHLNTVKVTQ